MNEEIARRIPHRSPFLFVDEIVSEEDGRLTARFRAPPEAEFFRGHYPGNPIMPGVLLSEAVFQAGALLVGRGSPSSRSIPAGAAPVLARIREARFRSIVRPGEELTITVRLKDRMGHFFFLSGAVQAGERRVMTIEFGVALASPDGITPADPSA